jgi:hypothetical protein
VWPELQQLNACAAMRDILGSIVQWDWKGASQALLELGIGDFQPLVGAPAHHAAAPALGGGGGMDTTGNAAQAADPSTTTQREEAARALMDVAAQQHVACVRLVQSIGREIAGDGLHLGPDLASRRAELSCVLLSHVLANRGTRLRGMYARREQPLPFAGSPAATRIIFLQAAKAIKRLHDGGRDGCGARVHGDVKLENFVLTSQGLVKLLDFGFALELGTPRRAAVRYPPYGSPQLHILNSKGSVQGDNGDWILTPETVLDAVNGYKPRAQETAAESAAKLRLKGRAEAAAAGARGVCVKEILKVMLEQAPAHESGIWQSLGTLNCNCNMIHR